MIKTIAIGIWACLVALASAYIAATWQSGTPVEIAMAPSGEVTIEGVEYRRPNAITVPMISDGRLTGYVVAKIVFTANAHDLHDFPLDPQPFVLDEAFRLIYTDGKVEFDRMSKYNLDDITNGIKANVNSRLGFNLIHDVLIEELNYVDKESVRPQRETTPQ
jgi:hypothetical protein